MNIILKKIIKESKMVYIPNDLSLKHTFKYVDTMFDNWFTKHGYTFSRPSTASTDFAMSLTDYFTNISSFTPDQVLSGMLLMYFNYPINWLKYNNHTIKGTTLWYQMSIYKLICFLKKSKMPNIKENVYKIVETFADQTVITSLFDIKGKISINIFTKKYPTHILSDKRIVQLIKDREKTTLFGTDKELIAIMNKKLVDKVMADIAIFAKEQQKLADEMERNRRIQARKAMGTIPGKLRLADPTEVRVVKDYPKRQVVPKVEKSKFLKYTGEFLY